MGFLHRVGIDTGKRLRRHVDEDGDILLHEVGVGPFIYLREARPKLRLRLGKIGADLS